MLLRSLGQMAGAREITTLGNNKATIVGGRLWRRSPNLRA